MIGVKIRERKPDGTNHYITHITRAPTKRSLFVTEGVTTICGEYSRAGSDNLVFVSYIDSNIDCPGCIEQYAKENGIPITLFRLQLALGDEHAELIDRHIGYSIDDLSRSTKKGG